MVSEEQEIIAQVILSNSTFIYAGSSLLSEHALFPVRHSFTFTQIQSHLGAAQNSYSVLGFDRDTFLKVVTNTTLQESALEIFHCGKKNSLYDPSLVRMQQITAVWAWKIIICQYWVPRLPLLLLTIDCTQIWTKYPYFLELAKIMLFFLGIWTAPSCKFGATLVPDSLVLLFD